jgi:hypothetical protein
MDIPMIFHLQFGFSQFISFREEDLWNFSQSEHIIGTGSHIEHPTGTKNSNFVEDHPRNIPAKFGSNRPGGFNKYDDLFLIDQELNKIWTNSMTYFWFRNFKLKKEPLK